MPHSLLLASLYLLSLLLPGRGVSAASTVTGCAANSTDITHLFATNTITLGRGTYCLSEYVFVAHTSGFLLTGTTGDSHDTIIQCSEGAGLAFLNITELILSYVTILNCGVTGSNLTEFVRQVNGSVDMFYRVPDDSSAGVLIAASSNVNLLHVEIRESRGYGLIAINLYGQSNVTGAVFDRNRPVSSIHENLTVEDVLENVGMFLGGGAIFMYFDLVNGFAPSESPQLLVKEGSFTNNTVYYAPELLLSFYQFSASVQETGYVLGGGGGLSLKLCQSMYVVDTVVEFTNFMNSDAVIGGGAHIVWYEHTPSSNITFSDCFFAYNGQEVSEENSTYGGGVSILSNLAHPGYETLASGRVLLTFEECVFLSNRATTGGAVHVRAPFSRLAASIPNLITFRGCVFDSNEAAFGCAVSISSGQVYGNLPVDVIRFENCELTGSVSTFFANLSSLALGGAAIYSLNGAVVLRNSVITLTLGAGLAAVDSRIDIEGDVFITHNSASFGAGASIQGLSYIVMNDNSNLTFAFNTAARAGGGILYTPPRRAPFLTVQYDCFLLFRTYDLLCSAIDCTFLGRNISINFKGNRALFGSMIYGSLLNTCPWALNLTQPYGQGGRNGKDNIVEILFSDYSEYFRSDTVLRDRGVNANPNSISVDSLGGRNVSVMPGQIFVVNGTSMDGLGQAVGDVVTASVVNNTFDGDNIRFNAVLMDANLWLVLNNSQSELRVMGPENQNLTLSLRSTISLARNLLNVSLTSCTDGFNFNNASRQCECDPQFNPDNQNVICSSTYGNISVSEGYWFGNIQGNTQLGTDGDSYLVALCSSPNCNTMRNGRAMINTADLDEQCMPGHHGVLCGGCREGYSINLGTFTCTRCPGYEGIALILFFLLVGVSVVVLIAVLDINISNGWLKGMILYANIFVIFREDLLTRGSFPVYFIFSWLSLQWGIPSCFFDRLRPIQSTGLEFLFPIYMWVLVIAIIVIFARCPLKEKWRSLVKNPPKVFATILLLSFTSLMGTSIRILGAETIRTFSGATYVRWRVDPNVPYLQTFEHAILALFSMAIIVFLVVCTLILLIPRTIGGHQVKCCRLWVVGQHRMKPILDSFYAPFKETWYVLRSWEGWRFVFRVALHLIANFAPQLYRLWIALAALILFMFLQAMLAPYKKIAQNWVDSLFLLNMLLLIFVRTAELTYLTQNRTPFTVFYHILLVSALLASLGVIAFSCYPATKILFLMARKKVLEHKNKEKEVDVNENASEMKENPGVLSATNEMAEERVSHSIIDVPKGPSRESFIFHDSEETNTKL